MAAMTFGMPPGPCSSGIHVIRAAHDRRMPARPVVQRVLREEGYNLALLGVTQSLPN